MRISQPARLEEPYRDNSNSSVLDRDPLRRYERDVRCKQTLRSLTSLLIRTGACLTTLVPISVPCDTTFFLKEAIRLHLLSPALSSDGRRVVMATPVSTEDPDAEGSLVLLDTGGNVLRRLPLYSLASHPIKARASFEEASRILTNGGFRRMGRVEGTSIRLTVRQTMTDPPPSFFGTFSHAQYGFTIVVQNKRLRVDAIRGARRLRSVTIPIGEERRCEHVASYSVKPSDIGFDPERRLLAFLLLAFDRSHSVCVSHEFVVALR